MKVTHTTRPLIVRIGTATGHGAPAAQTKSAHRGSGIPKLHSSENTSENIRRGPS